MPAKHWGRGKRAIVLGNWLKHGTKWTQPLCLHGYVPKECRHCEQPPPTYRCPSCHQPYPDPGRAEACCERLSDPTPSSQP